MSIHNIFEAVLRPFSGPPEAPIDPPEPQVPPVTLEQLTADYVKRITEEVQRMSTHIVVHGRSFDLGNELKECMLPEEMLAFVCGIHSSMPGAHLPAQAASLRVIKELATSFALDDIDRGRNL